MQVADQSLGGVQVTVLGDIADQTAVGKGIPGAPAFGFVQRADDLICKAQCFTSYGIGLSDFFYLIFAAGDRFFQFKNFRSIRSSGLFDGLFLFVF